MQWSTLPGDDDKMREFGAERSGARCAWEPGTWISIAASATMRAQRRLLREPELEVLCGAHGPSAPLLVATESAGRLVITCSGLRL